MPDETEIAKAVAEGAAKGTADAALEPLKAFLMPFCREVGEGLGQYGTVIKQRLRLRAERALKMLSEANLTPEPMSLKLFVPIAQNAALEDDEFLQESWSALLANAANPKSKIKVHPAFPGILKNLTPAEADLLNGIYCYVCHQIEMENLPRISNSARNVDLSEAMAGYGTIHVLDVSELPPMIDSLQTQGVLDTAVQHLTIDRQYPTEIPAFRMTALGFEFVTACHPPGYSPWKT